jgi:hypothetical protein
MSKSVGSYVIGDRVRVIGSFVFRDLEGVIIGTATEWMVGTRRIMKDGTYMVQFPPEDGLAFGFKPAELELIAHRGK